MDAILSLLGFAITVYIWIIIIQVLISWLVIFDVININNAKAQNLVGLLRKATDPVFKPLQKFIPPIGGIDVTPIIVILGLSIVQNLLI